MILQDFLTSLLGIILGIILTFGVNHLWRRREENKRTKDMLILVRNELTKDKELFKFQEEMLKKDGFVYEKILEAKKDLTQIPVETIKEYLTQVQVIAVSGLITTAWQILQNSELIQKMTDKEMVIRLTECYAWMNSWHDYIEKEYWGIKKKMLVLDLEDPYLFFDSVLKNSEFVGFYNEFSLDKEDKWEMFLVTDAMIDFTISLLDKHGDYRYNMDEMDKERDSFIEARIIQNQEEKL